NIKVDSNEFFFCIHTAKKGLSPFLLQVKKYFYPLLFVNFEPLIRILNIRVKLEYEIESNSSFLESISALIDSPLIAYTLLKKELSFIDIFTFWLLKLLMKLKE
ncbi:MAG: hypothetical protein N3F62_00485, partial [Bacteroidia bacterium]|nr:hypothetical protein [Bacteroidia bacterium]